MAVTKQDQAVAGANTLISLMGVFRGLRAQVNDLITAYTNEGWSTVWAAFPTALQNADGTLGTADGAPNTTHPVDTRVVTGLAKSVTETQLVNAIVCLQQLQKFLTNQAVATSNYGTNVDDLASG